MFAVLPKVLFLSLILFWSLPFSASFANAVKTLHTKYNGWKVVSYVEGDQKFCYTVSYPTQKVGNYEQEREAYAIVNILPSNKVEFSISAGYEYRSSGVVNLNVGGKEFKLVGKGKMAWAESQAVDNSIISMLQISDKMLVKSESIFGNYTIDTYNLEGFTSAYRKILDLCNVT